MRSNLYSSYFEEIGNGRRLRVCIVAKYDRIFQLFAGEKMYCCIKKEEGMEIFQDEATEKKMVVVPVGTQWLIQSNDKFYQIYVTEWTKNLQTPFEGPMNKIINQKVKEVQNVYQKKKKEERRLYWYHAGKNELESYTVGLIYLSRDEKYDLKSNSNLQAIDRQFPVPKKSCFVLGRVTRTVITKKEKLLDFVEPIAQFMTDSEAIQGLFYDEKEGLGNILLRMLVFSIQKNEPSELVSQQIKNKTHKSVQDFMKELETAFKTGDIQKIRTFDELVNPICYIR